MTGSQLIAEERKRQIEAEGWTPEHDRQHAGGELRKAAACYLHELEARRVRVDASQQKLPDLKGACEPLRTPPPRWPWDNEWWKSTADEVRQLVKAGALVAAEIDRIQAESHIEKADGRQARI